MSKQMSVSRFTDISIYRRVQDSVFVSLTERELEEYGAGGSLTFYDIKGIEPDYNYAISVQTGTKNKYVAGIKLSELILLTGIKSKPFIKQLGTGLDDIHSEDLIAELCAKKIVSYAYGKCVQELRDNSGYIYINFYRTTFTNKKRIYPAVLSKPFRNAVIKFKEVDVWETLMNSMKGTNAEEITIVR